MDLLVEPVLPRGHYVIEVVVARLVAIGIEVAKLPVVDIVQTGVKSIIVTPGDPSPAEEAGREALPVYQAHVRARLNCPCTMFRWLSWKLNMEPVWV